ncbi:MAG: sulfide/dihydroorotate dehydrogenase-like FAD/NAD-binding protein [Eubacteriaceae bacterium]|jgi:ferredoxin--NADP+ reductase
MFEIVKKQMLADNIVEFVVKAPRIAKHCEPGQFVIVKEEDKTERIPLTICDYDRKEGTITLVIQIVGKATQLLSELDAGQFIAHVTGPLGKPSEFTQMSPEELKEKRLLFVAGGLGAAPVFPQVRWAHEHGVPVDVIIGAKTKDILILEDEMKAVCDNLYIATDDGSYGYHGLVTGLLEDLVVNQGKKYTDVIAIGPMIMMKFAALKTKELGLPTIVSLNPIMVDGTGMCGACRVLVDGKVKFACVDGPEFDGHLVDFDQAMQRQRLYKTEEGRKFLEIEEKDTHHGGCGVCSEVE